MAKTKEKKMIFYEDEEKILKTIELHKDVLPEEAPNSSDRFKKRRELFHALVFLYLEGSSVAINMIRMPKDGEGADIEIEKHKRAIEITECLDGDDNHEDFKRVLNSMFMGEYSEPNDNSMTAGLKKSLHDVISNKNEKIERYRKDGYSVELLIISDEAYDNCSVTGTWVEKFLDKSDIEKLQKIFDEIFILIYHSSGKDGGPIIRKIPDDIIEYRTIVGQ